MKTTLTREWDPGSSHPTRSSSSSPSESGEGLESQGYQCKIPEGQIKSADCGVKVGRVIENPVSLSYQKPAEPVKAQALTNTRTAIVAERTTARDNCPDRTTKATNTNPISSPMREGKCSENEGVAAQSHSVPTSSSHRNVFGGPSPESLPKNEKQESAEVPNPGPSPSRSPPLSKNQRKKERRKQNKQRNGPNGRTRAANGNAAVNASVTRTDQQAQGDRDAQKVIDAEQEAIEEEEKLKKQYLATVKKIGCRYVRYLGMILEEYWQGSYYSESMALHELVNQLVAAGLKISVSHNPDIILGVINADIEAPFHLLSYRVFPANADTPFYDQRITPDYMASVLRVRPRLWWTDGDQMILCDDGAEESPLWRNGSRFDLVTVPRSFAGEILPNGPTGDRNFLSDSLIRCLVKPHRTFSEMSFGSQVQSVLSSASRPTWAEWSFGALHDTLLAVNYENYLFFQDRCYYGDRRTKYDDTVVETLTGVRLGGWAVSFGMVKEANAAYIQPGMEQISAGVRQKWQEMDLSGYFRSEPEDPPGPPGAPEPPPEAPAAEGNNANPDRELIQEEEPEGPAADQGEPLLESMQRGVEGLVNQINLPEFEWPVIEIPEVPSLSFEQHPVVLVFQGVEKFNAIKKFLRKKASGLTEKLRKWMEQVMERPLHSWQACSDKWEEVKEELLARFQMPDLGVTLASILAVIQAIKILDALSQMTFEGCLEFMEKNYGVSKRVARQKLRRIRQQTIIIYMLVRRNQWEYIPLVLSSSNMVPSLTARTEVDMVLIDELPIQNKEQEFVPGPMVVTWQEYCESTDQGNVLFRNFWPSMGYDEDRVLIEIDPAADFTCGRFSEVYYGLYFMKARCYNKDYLPICLKKRIGREGVPYEYNAMRNFNRMLDASVFPRVSQSQEACLTLEEYMPYIENMPCGSRNKHIEYFQSMEGPIASKEPFTDHAFTKSDEVLAAPKGRGIINPPPSLFYELVVGVTSVKKAFKRKLLNKIYHKGEISVYLTYGADMTQQEKSEWMTKVMSSHRNTYCAYILVGGDDNLTLFDIKGRWCAWESDVTACDQSHNAGLIGVMCDVFSKMLASREWIKKLEASYRRPIKTKEMTVRFHEPQLHTGHPQTSVCNSVVVGFMACFLASLVLDLFSRKQLDFPEDEFSCRVMEEFLDARALELGMIWKNEIHSDPRWATFHKGCWIPSSQGHQWLPLPSCLWKASKIRTDQRISQKELLLRLAFNHYQRILNPSFSFVQVICSKQFDYIIDLALPGEGHQVTRFQNYLEKASGGFLRYVESLSQKNGEAGKIDAYTNRTEDWTPDAEEEFLLHRYGLGSEDLQHFIQIWDGGFGRLSSPFMLSAIFRDYMSNHREFASQVHYFLTDDLVSLESLSLL